MRERDVGLLGALGWWAFDIATLWACFKAFGDSPPLGVLIMGYFVGMIANIIPTPGGVGAVEGGMIGTYAAFGVGFGYATAAVLAYRVFAFLMPTIPGVIAFIRLRGTVADGRPRTLLYKVKYCRRGRALRSENERQRIRDRNRRRRPRRASPPRCTPAARMVSTIVLERGAIGGQLWNTADSRRLPGHVR